MAKWGTYFILGALVAMVLPYVLMFFEAFQISENPAFPIFSLLFGGVGVVLHLVNALKTNTINGSSVLLLTSILTIIYGFSLKTLGIPNSQYLLLTGVLLVAVWIMIPGTKKEE